MDLSGVVFTDGIEIAMGEGTTLEAGAFGLSTGLVYEPGKYSKTGELVELTRELRGSGALYATHMRDEGTGLLESVREAIEIGEVDEGSCLYCCACVDHCPTDALDMSARPKRSLMPLRVLEPGAAI